MILSYRLGFICYFVDSSQADFEQTFSPDLLEKLFVIQSIL